MDFSVFKETKHASDRDVLNEKKVSTVEIKSHIFASGQK